MWVKCQKSNITNICNVNYAIKYFYVVLTLDEADHCISLDFSSIFPFVFTTLFNSDLDPPFIRNGDDKVDTIFKWPVIKLLSHFLDLADSVADTLRLKGHP